MDTSTEKSAGEANEGGASKTRIAVIAFLVLILAGGIVYFAVKLRQKKAAAIQPPFEIPAETLTQMIEIAGQMETVEAEQRTKIEKEQAGLTQSAENAVKAVEKIKEETAKTEAIQAQLDAVVLPGSPLDFNPR